MAAIVVQNIDALSCEVDVFALKYAQQTYGLDHVVVSALERGGRRLDLPQPWTSWLVRGIPGQTPPSLLFVGVPRLQDFQYAEIRKYSYQVLVDLTDKAPDARSIGMTLHGAGYGLDEREAFESQLAGILDAIRDGKAPSALDRIIFAERDRDRAARLSHWLSLTVTEINVHHEGATATERVRASQPERMRSVGHESWSKPHIFVAMPFGGDFDDVFHYGIQNASHAAGFLCERADLSSFTGDVIDWVKTRIKTSSLVVADLTGANPNVYLEVGFAWGCNVPTVLLARDTSELRFDVKTQRCLTYKKIKDLEHALTTELSSLKPMGRPTPA